jgi:TetR/AcrR family transcriptional repressor of nem operon
MSRTPNARKEDSYDRILTVAARAIRERGYAGISVAGVMKDAGMTHGGFYAHFESREDLLVKAIERAAHESSEAVKLSTERRAAKGVSPFRALVETYLADALLESLGTGCPVAALSSDMPRQSPDVRNASTIRVQGLIALVGKALSPAHRKAAGTVAATLVGALQLGRALGDTEQGRSVLSSTRKSLVEQYDNEA